VKKAWGSEFLSFDSIRASATLLSMIRRLLVAGFLVLSSTFAHDQPAIPAPAVVDAAVRRVMAETHANGLALAIIDQGQVHYVQSYGERNAQGDKLETDTVMYGASLTKLVFAHAVMQLVDAGKLDLDAPFAGLLDKPLPEYPAYAALADDPRWQALTPRIALTHSTGFANFAFLEPDQKLRIHFQPGSRYAYSGEGLILLQFVLERGRKDRGLGVPVGELTDRTFTQLGMTRTSLKWRADFAGNLADGWNDKGEPLPHDQRSRVRAAGSMDTTIHDLALFAAALMRGDGLSPAARAELVRPQLPITTAHQFPTLQPELPPAQRRPDLQAALGCVTFTGPQGPGFFKGGHNEQTANTLVALERGRRCVVILSNDVRAEAGFAELIQLILGETGVPYDWEYGDQAGKSNG
jgi:CubicO group peptidase (beta-lactamase class C family)